MKIFLDMDEVLADFVGGACRAWGITREVVEQYWPAGAWDIIPPLTVALSKQRCPGTSGFPPSMGHDEFWEHINGSEDYWLDLEALPWARVVTNLMYWVTDDWYIVSAPSRCPYSYSGKVKWLQRFFSPAFNRFVLTSHKHLLAGPNTLLIDDRDSNVEEFVAAGGAGIVFPRHHNSQHLFKSDPVKYLKNALEVHCRPILSCG